MIYVIKEKHFSGLFFSEYNRRKFQLNEPSTLLNRLVPTSFRNVS